MTAAKLRKTRQAAASPGRAVAPFVASGVPADAGAWIGRALQHANDARTLKLHGGSPEAVYNYSGMAVEVALKAVIMRREGLAEFPGRRQDPGLYVHGLAGLLERAGLKPLLDDELRNGTNLGANWLAVRDWCYNTPRYPQGQTPREYAAAYYMAATHRQDGVLTWLTMIFRQPPP